MRWIREHLDVALLLAGAAAVAVFVYLLRFRVHLLGPVGIWVEALSVLAAAIVAVGQLRALRRSTDFDTFTRTIGPTRTDAFLRASSFLSRAIPLPAPYQLEFALGKTAEWKAEANDSIQLVLNVYDSIGISLRHGLVDRSLLLENICLIVVGHCDQLDAYIKATQSVNAGYYAGVTYLRGQAEAYRIERGFSGPVDLLGRIREALQRRKPGGGA